MTSLLNGIYIAKQDLLSIPPDLAISTTTVTMKVNVVFNVENIGLYFDDFDNILIGKRYGNRVVNNLINIKKIKSDKKKKRKEKKNFYNQVSLIFRTCTLMGLDPSKISQKEGLKTVNVKLFINGSIQMTGCKHLDNIRSSLELLFEKLKITKVILNRNMEFIEKPFVIDTTLLNINNVNNFYIQMINTNFNIQFHINRSKLFQLLLDNNIDASFDPIIHACVNIKYYLSTKKTKTISIFVFESGSITIAGSNSCSEILEAYNFINKFILSNYSLLLTKDITPHLIIDFIKRINFNQKNIHF
jgi:TATA-box binding protein (TBP) (component of TFIID and TFIIIB)